MRTMQKKDWIVQINQSINRGVPFVYSSVEPNKSQLLFACDTFRRKKHDVVINIEPSVGGQAIVHIVIHPFPTCIDFTVKRDTDCKNIQAQLEQNMTKIRVRGCGGAIDVVFQFTAWAINNGWYIEKNIMNTLTRTTCEPSKKNTTFQVVLRRGS